MARTKTRDEDDVPVVTSLDWDEPLGLLPDGTLNVVNENDPTPNVDEEDVRRMRMTDAEPRTLYVRRDVVNAADIIAWAKSAGFTDLVPAEEMHVTICYSRTPVDWMTIQGEIFNQREDGTVYVPPGGVRIVEPLGDQGAIVLLFACSPLSWRHEQIKRDSGASFDYDQYQPHITLAYDENAARDFVLRGGPYRGEIILGPEIFEEIEE